MPPDVIQIVLVGLIVGVVAGIVGGLAGIGGSIIMLPALALTLGYSDEAETEHHLYMASAMCVNVVVALAAHRRHRKKGAHDPRLQFLLLPGMVAGIIAGVMLSEQLEGRVLQAALVGFLMLYCVYNAATAVFKLPERERDGVPPIGWRVVTIGSGTGVVSGLLGIGGGILMVPLMQVCARAPLKKAIAASAGVMWLSAAVGATAKLIGLGGHGLSWVDALVIALPMGVGAMLGAPIGASLTHRLELPHLKLAISAILAVAGARLAGWW